MKKAIGIVFCVVCVLAIGLSVAAIAIVVPRVSEKEAIMDTQYVVYLGTNDKDTNLPVFTPEQARAELEEILLAHFGGYTIQEANGGWIDGETVYREYTLVIHLSDTTLDAVHAAADEMIQVFHQSSVLIQRNSTLTDFYSGSN